MMLLEIHLRAKNLSNNSATSGSVGEQFFPNCEGYRGSTYVWATCTMLCFVVGFPSCIAILWEMFKTYRRGTSFTPNDFFILNLATMDAVFLVFIPLGLLNHFIWQTRTVEAIWNSLYAFNTCGRPLLMACACIDCYLAVVHPITYHKMKSLAPRVVMVTTIWALTIVSGIAYAFVRNLFYSLFPTVTFLIAIVIIGVCDCFIVCTLIKSDRGRNKIHPQKQRAIHTLIYSLAMTVFSYLPPVFLFTIGRSLIPSFIAFICTVAIPITITSSSGSAFMPLLYLYNAGKLDCFRAGYCRS